MGSCCHNIMGSCFSSSSASNPPPPPPPPPPPNPSSSSQSCDYHVFLSFCGKDTRKTFVDHLYATLCQRGIRTFKDNERLEEGKPISPQLLKAIEQSRSAVVVFSQNYASSSWCLDELVKIMDCKLAVFPVFYNVHPWEVRRQSGTFGGGFRKAAERNHVEKANVWRKALHDAANLSGYDLRNTADGLESQCIKKVVDWCSSHSFNIYAAIDKDLIGMPSRVSNLIKLLQLGRDSGDDVRMIGIWGMGGAGKTTLADVTFHKVKKLFDGASFIADVREKSKRSDGLQLLQKKILSDILKDKNLEVDSVPEGKEMIKDRLGRKKVLIILDDVDDDDQLRALAEDRKWFGTGSRILITTRDEHVLKVQEVEEIYSMNLLTKNEAIQLFSRHAFKRSSPTTGYDELSLQVVRYAQGLPLALKILGSSLRGRDTDVWTSALKRLKKNPEGKIAKMLQISFDGLEQVEKEIFLDIACFFKRWKKDEVIRMLDTCGFNSAIGIDVLIEKSLISLSNDEKLQMHDLLREMGRNIGRHSRIWHHDDIKDVLQNNTETEAIEAIVGDHIGRFDEHTSSDASKAFMNMKKLRLLHLTTYKWGHKTRAFDLPNELQWLSWKRYPSEFLGESFQAPKLVGLEMTYSSIIHLWKGEKLLDKLTYLDLSHSKKLIKTPDFSSIPNLETLKLMFCSNLIEVHPSLGDLKRLVLLNLKFCKNLVDFPSSIQMKSLEILNLSSCFKFKRFPELRGNMDRLSKLSLDCTAIECLPSSIANLTKLDSMDLGYCRYLSDLPDTICMLKNLKKMGLVGCKKLKKLPENLGHIEGLEELDLSCTGVEVLPSFIGHLKNHRHVSNFSGHWKSIPEVVSKMTCIGSCLKVLNLSRCRAFDYQSDPNDVGHLSFLEILDLGNNGFASVPFIISQLSRLKILDLSSCVNLKALPELPPSIAILKADSCRSLESIESLLGGKHKWLWMVTLKGCISLTMHEKCERLYCCHEQENSMIIGQQLKHCKTVPLLKSMLQGHAVIDHLMDVRYIIKGSVDHAIPEWFGQQVMKGNRFDLKLPSDWPNKITGFVMCAVFNYPMRMNSLGISLSEVGWQIQAGLHANLARWPADGDYEVWIGYISLKMLQRSTESVMSSGWMDTATQLHLTFSIFPYNFDHDDDVRIGWCGARVVCMDEVENSEGTTLSSSFTCSSLQQQYDPNFAAKTMIPCSKVYGTADHVNLDLPKLNNWDMYGGI